MKKTNPIGFEIAIRKAKMIQKEERAFKEELERDIKKREKIWNLQKEMGNFLNERVKTLAE